MADFDARAWALAFKNLFFPIFCLACGARLLTEDNGYYCPTCWELAGRIEPPLCTRCGRPHEAMVGLGSTRSFPCANCREKPLRAVRRIYGAAVYDGVVADAVKHLKFHDKSRLARPLGAMLREFAVAHLDTDVYDMLVPVPLHKVRLRDRGYNQSELLAREVLPAFGRAACCSDLKRIRPTRTQSTLKGKKRKANVRGAFAVEGDTVAGRTVLLIDDVVTSGGTVEECAKALKRAKAVSVDVLVVALAARHHPA